MDPVVAEFPLGQDLLTAFDYALDGLFKVDPTIDAGEAIVRIGPRSYSWREFLWTIVALPRSARLMVDEETSQSLHEYLGPAWPSGKIASYHMAAEALLQKLAPVAREEDE